MGGHQRLPRKEGERVFSLCEPVRAWLEELQSESLGSGHQANEGLRTRPYSDEERQAGRGISLLQGFAGRAGEIAEPMMISTTTHTHVSPKRIRVIGVD